MVLQLIHFSSLSYTDLPKYCFSQRFLGIITDKNDIIKTEPTHEDQKVSSVEFITARMLPPSKKYKIDQEDTFTRKVDHVPATADREAVSVWETLFRAIIGSETAKMLKSMGIAEITKEEFEKEETKVQEFLSGGSNPSTRAAISIEQFLKRQIRREELKIKREMERKTIKRRIMTRKTAEREKRKNKGLLENPPKIWVKIRRRL
uniref:Uncharacterized protein n=1 Tax=Tetranychus urticae TaxID=32264 RepID=T1JTV4_TETUR